MPRVLFSREYSREFLDTLAETMDARDCSICAGLGVLSPTMAVMMALRFGLEELHFICPCCDGLGSHYQGCAN